MLFRLPALFCPFLSSSVSDLFLFGFDLFLFRIERFQCFQTGTEFAECFSQYLNDGLGFYVNV